MKLNITKKEYRILLEMLYLADWMMHSHTIDTEGLHPEHEVLKKKILSNYKEMGAEDIIEHSKVDDDYYEFNGYDEYIHEKFIASYDDSTFWEELIDRLAERDVVRRIGIEQYKALDGIDRIMKVEEAKKHYANEFKAHGLERVSLEGADNGR